MQRLADHFRHAPAPDKPLAAERPVGRPPLHRETFRGLPVWFHQTADGSMTADDGRSRFDPDDAIACVQYEHYLPPKPEGKRLKALYYLFKPLLPRGAQLALQRWHAARRLRAVEFPKWPQDDSLTDLLGALLAECMRVAGVDRVPCIGLWPRGKTWAWTLTHDVDTGLGYAHVDALAAVEEKRGLRSCWYFVPERYPLERRQLDAVRERGHEIGVHGLQHSGKLFSSRAEFERRVGRINAYVREWGVTGFRSPATYRNPFWLPELEVDHDSSYMDNASCEPQRGGVCAPFPFMLSERLVELPISLPMDHTLMNILRRDVVAACSAKTDWVRRQHGLAVALFHPDYNTTESRRERYGALLDEIGADSAGWGALPHEVASWWQRRRHSHIEMRDGAPIVVGAAAEDARVWWAHRDGDRIGWAPT